jgi:hypothetical protein
MSFCVLSPGSIQNPEFLHNNIHKQGGFVPQKMTFLIFLYTPPLATPTAFTGKCHTIGAPITNFTMPFPPVPAGTTFFTMPSAAVLYNLIPTK